MNTIQLVDFDPNWKILFQQEAEILQHSLGKLLSAIHHIGSTAIQYIKAKPIIDILIECDNLDDIALISKILTKLNYADLRRNVIPHTSFITHKYSENIGYHLHIFERGDPQVKRHVNFRDYVNQDPEVALQYELLKRELASQFADNRIAYVSGKEKLVQAIDAKAKTWSGRKKNYLPPQTGVAANRWTGDKLINAMEANLNVHMTHFAQYLNHVELIRKPGLAIVNSGLLDDTFNYVLDGSSASINEAKNYFNDKKLPFSWWVNQTEEKTGLAEELLKADFKNSDNNTAMYFDLDSWEANNQLPLELEIIQAKDEKTLHDFALVLANDENCFKTYFSWIASVMTDDDPIEYYVGYVDGKPVVRGLSCYYGQVAGLHWLSTSPHVRKKGYGTAMQEFRLKRAKELGYHVAVLQASSEGYPLYKKLGYKECGVVREFKLIK